MTGSGVRHGLRLLRLAQAVPANRRRQPTGFSRPRRHDDLAGHGQQLQQRARAITVEHLARPAVLGVDPRLVLVIELNAPVDPDEFRRAGLQILDGSSSQVVVAFADDPALAAFQERLDELQAGPRPGARTEPHAQFFDAIDTLHPLEPTDRLTTPLQATIETADPATTLRLDVECWHPDDRAVAQQWLDDLSRAVEAGGGRVADRYVNDAAGLLLARVYLAAGAIADLAQLDVVARIDVLPIPALTVPELYDAAPDRLPAVVSPVAGSPIVGIVDSGVRSAHPLLAGTVVTADAIGTGISEGEDEHGHGTMVAALLLHGPVDQAVAAGRPLRPWCRIVSARVLNARSEFPEEDLWERDVAEAIEWCANQGASIINLSIGDRRTRLSTSRQLGMATVVDELARRHDLVVVTCTGNIPPLDYLEGVDSTAVTAYPEHLLASDRAQLIDPAPAMLALTVGGITTARAATGLAGRETVTRVPMGQPGWPAPFTRVGPGVAGAIKPELTDIAGTFGIESGRLADRDAELGVISAGASVDRLLTFDIGTSFAAPLVTRIAAAVKARFPAFSANLVRALVLLSSEPPSFGPELIVERPADRENAVRRLLGYGRPSLSRAIESTSHRVVLVAEAAIPINGIHIYQLPVPGSFFESGGQRGLDVALAFDPPTRARRLDYLASRMAFYVVRGMDLNQVAEVFAALDPDTIDLDNDQDTDSDPRDNKPPTVSQLGARHRPMSPSPTIRSRGTNQLARTTFSQRLDRAANDPMYLIVRNVNRWDDLTATQPYAICAALWRTEDDPELYAELEAQLEAVIELPLEIELST